MSDEHVSDTVHVTVRKALRVLGLGLDHLVVAPTDADGRVDPARLPALDDRGILCLQAGEVNTGEFDPFGDIVPAAQAAALADDGPAGASVWFGATVWRGRPALRLSVSSWRTTEADVDAAVSARARPSVAANAQVTMRDPRRCRMASPPESSRTEPPGAMRACA